MSLFPMYLPTTVAGAVGRGGGGGELIIHAAYFCVEAFPPHHRLCALVMGRPGPLRPDLVLVPGDDYQVQAWLCHASHGAGLEPAAARRIVEAANQVEARFMTVMRERQAQLYAEGRV